MDVLSCVRTIAADTTLERVMEKARIELLQKMPIFGGIGTDALDFLLASCPIDTVRAGEYFFREDDDGDCMFVLEAGAVDVLKAWDGQDHLLHTLNEGDCFGEMSVIDHCARSASVRAVEDCSAIRISSGNLYRLYAHDIKQFALIQMNMGREVSRRLRDANDQLFGAKMKVPQSGIRHVFAA
jgi:CRP/FNR family transcriptional regulator, cyclic AMP receptor protein